MPNDVCSFAIRPSEIRHSPVQHTLFTDEQDLDRRLARKRNPQSRKQPTIRHLNPAAHEVREEPNDVTA